MTSAMMYTCIAKLRKIAENIIINEIDPLISKTITEGKNWYILIDQHTPFVNDFIKNEYQNRGFKITYNNFPIGDEKIIISWGFQSHL